MPYNPRDTLPEQQMAARARFRKKMLSFPARHMTGPFAMALGQPESYWKGVTKGRMEAAYGAAELKNPGQIDLELLYLRTFAQACGDKNWKDIKRKPGEHA